MDQYKRCGRQSKLVAYYNLPISKGVLITNVLQGGEAESQEYDRNILVRIDDIPINNVET